MSIENLPSNPKILPPIAKKQYSRPKIKWIRKGAWKHKETHCRNYRATGYNIVGCQSALASNGWQQRVWDRELSLDSSSKASEGLDLGDLGGSNELDSSNESDGSNELDGSNKSDGSNESDSSNELETSEDR